MNGDFAILKTALAFIGSDDPRSDDHYAAAKEALYRLEKRFNKPTFAYGEALKAVENMGKKK